MKILLNKDDLNEALYGVSNLGFVPTMGSLHNGHISLIRKSLNQCKNTIVTIFINPTQFNNKNDFIKYPRNRTQDLQILKKLKVNFVYMPTVKEIYQKRRAIKIKLKKEEKILCAKYRKGHFEGVIDVMDRFTKLIQPQKIFMGEKDFQQIYLVKKFIKKRYKSKIVSCKTIRSNNKLALSSRNSLLNGREKDKAEKITKCIFQLKRKLFKYNKINEILRLEKKKIENKFNIKIEYLELREKKNLSLTNKIENSKIFIAYYINKIRLIDNI